MPRPRPIFAFPAALLAATLLLCGAAPSARAQTAIHNPAAPKQPTSPVPAPPADPDAPGVPIDRLVATVNNDLVLDSDIDQERRFESIQPYNVGGNDAGEPSSSRDALLERLINQTLILQQTQIIPGSDIADKDIDAEITELRKQIPACRAEDCVTDAGWTRYLAGHGFTPTEFRARWKQRMQVLAFIEERFRQGIKIEPAAIQAYYTKTMLPEYQRRHVKAPKLDVLSDRISEVLLEQQVSTLLRDWLTSLRAQGSVVVLHPGEVAP